MADIYLFIIPFLQVLRLCWLIPAGYPSRGCPSPAQLMNITPKAFKRKYPGVLNYQEKKEKRIRTNLP
jgi:hypothetical protein